MQYIGHSNSYAPAVRYITTKSKGTVLILVLYFIEHDAMGNRKSTLTTHIKCGNFVV